jgi:hypothetical protein
VLPVCACVCMCVHVCVCARAQYDFFTCSTRACRHAFHVCATYGNNASSCVHANIDCKYAGLHAYVCMYVRTCGTYVCMYACMYACMHACIYVCARCYLIDCNYAGLHANVCMYVRTCGTYVCIYACMYICMYVQDAIL